MLSKLRHNHTLIRYSAASVLVAYACLMLISLGVFGMHSHAMTQQESCPYTQGTHSLCQMNTLGHIEAWKKATRTLVPLVFVFIAVITTAVIRTLLPQRTLSVVRQPYFPTLYTLLFAQGILHPKIP